MIIQMCNEWSPISAQAQEIEVEGLRTLCLAQKEQIDTLKRDLANLKLMFEVLFAKQAKVEKICN